MVNRLLLWTIALLAATIWSSTPVDASVTLDAQPTMVIEWLKFKVPAAQRSRYLEIDDQIWTSALKTYPGFLDKTTWLDPNQDNQVIFVISWATREQWKAIPEEELEQINQQFDQTLGFAYEMLESKEFIVPAGQNMDT